MDHKYVLTKKPIVQAKLRWYAKHRTEQLRKDNEALVEKLQFLQGTFYDQSLGREISRLLKILTVAEASINIESSTLPRQVPRKIQLKRKEMSPNQSWQHKTRTSRHKQEHIFKTINFFRSVLWQAKKQTTNSEIKVSQGSSQPHLAGNGSSSAWRLCSIECEVHLTQCAVILCVWLWFEISCI